MSLQFLRSKMSLTNLFKGRGDEASTQKPGLFRRVGRRPSRDVREKSSRLGAALFSTKSPISDDTATQNSDKRMSMKRHTLAFFGLFSKNRKDDSHGQDSKDLNDAKGDIPSESASFRHAASSIGADLLKCKAWDLTTADNSLAQVRVFHAAQLVMVKVLEMYLGQGNTKDFGFAFEEFNKAFSVMCDVKDRFLYPALDKVSGNAVLGSKLSNKVARINTLAGAIIAEYKAKKSVAAATFADWKSATLAHIDEEESVVMPLESKLGKSVTERMFSVFRDVTTPSFVTLKNDFGWTVGWVAMVLSQSEFTEVRKLELLGLLVQSMQLTGAPSQYAFVKERVKNNVDSSHWAALVKDYAADAPAGQSEPAYQKPPLSADPRFLPFFKMIKIGLPVEAVATKMALSKASASQEEALQILALDPNAPLPDKFEVKSMEKAASVASTASTTSHLSYLKAMHTSLRLAVASMQSLVDAGNMKDFSFVFEEFNKAAAVHSDLEERFVFPALDRAAKQAVSAAKLSSEHETERQLAGALMASLRTKTMVSSSAFAEWKKTFLSHLDYEDRVVGPLEDKLGASADARALVVFRDIVSPAFVQIKTELLWVLGWTAMVLSEKKCDIAELGSLLVCLQNVTSPQQYGPMRDKVKSNVSSAEWSKLVKDFGVDHPAKQTASAESVVPPVREDPRFAKYFKMVKVGMPLDAAATKMSLDQAAGSFELAVEILSLDPNLPLPERLTGKKDVTPKKEAPKATPAAPIAVMDNYLAFLRVSHDAFRLAIEQLSKYVATSNSKDFGFVWEELAKAAAVHADVEDRFVFPALDAVSSKAVTAAKLAPEHEQEKKLAAAITAEVQKSRIASPLTFEAWKTSYLAHLTREDSLLLPLESKLGKTADERAFAVFRDVITPAVGQMKSDVAWSLGWIVMVLSDSSSDASVASLTQLLLSLQSTSSQSQYAVLKTKVKSSASSELWSRLAKEVVDGGGRQQEPVYQKPSIKDDPRFMKYFKMIKVGMPAEAAASQMKREGAALDYDTALRILSLDPNKPCPDVL